MAIDPRKPRKFNPAKVKAYTVAGDHNRSRFEGLSLITLSNEATEIARFFFRVKFIIIAPVGPSHHIKL